jgi:hypothetical protein|tara:strand:- start:115 stop:216 length:102 start_codon:yes stop_codon:yes gene_type:complete
MLKLDAEKKYSKWQARNDVSVIRVLEPRAALTK